MPVACSAVASLPSPPAIASHSAAAASSSSLSCSVSAVSDISDPLLDEHFLEQHVLDFDRLYGGVDAQQQLLAQSVGARRTAQVLDPQLAQIDLEAVDDARQDGFDLRHRFRVGQLEADAQLEEIGALSARAEVHQYFGQFVVMAGAAFGHRLL